MRRGFEVSYLTEWLTHPLNGFRSEFLGRNTKKGFCRTAAYSNKASSGLAERFASTTSLSTCVGHRLRRPRCGVVAGRSMSRSAPPTAAPTRPFRSSMSLAHMALRPGTLTGHGSTATLGLKEKGGANAKESSTHQDDPRVRIQGQESYGMFSFKKVPNVTRGTREILSNLFRVIGEKLPDQALQAVKKHVTEKGFGTKRCLHRS